jgi:hypothetical protein
MRRLVRDEETREKFSKFSKHLCGCGCGQETGVYTDRNSKGEVVKGQPKRFLPGHYVRGTHCKRGHLKTSENQTKSGGCKECHYLLGKQRHDANPERSNAYTRKWRDKNRAKYNAKRKELRRLEKLMDPEKQKNVHLKNRYGITLDQYNAMLKAQDNRCAICRIEFASLEKPPSVDHCHDSDAVRGLLCHHCNVFVGFARNSVENLANAIQYLNKFKENQCQTQQKSMSSGLRATGPIPGVWVNPSQRESHYSMTASTI